MKTHQRAELQAATPPVPFRVHYADGDIRTVEAIDPEAARKAAARVGVPITKIKRDRAGEPR